MKNKDSIIIFGFIYLVYIFFSVGFIPVLFMTAWNSLTMIMSLMALGIDILGLGLLTYLFVKIIRDEE